MSDSNNVIVVWGYDPETGSFHTLSFSNGKSRIYERDKLDSRLGSLAFCSTLEQAQIATEGKGDKGAVQLAYPVAAEQGLL